MAAGDSEKELHLPDMESMADWKGRRKRRLYPVLVIFLKDDRVQNLLVSAFHCSVMFIDMMFAVLVISVLMIVSKTKNR